jgi:hydroxyethylthiazole kinase
MNTFADRAAENLAAVRRKAPLVHNITNFVVMNVTANALLAIGASPVMAHAPEEVEEMVGMAGALVLNIGTLTREWVPAMIRAGRAAGALGKPVVFDPVGVGATRFRTETAQKILKDAAVRIVRGNASEIRALSQGGPDNGSGHGSDDVIVARGVDAVHSTDEALTGARRLARRAGITMAITGPTDVVTDGRRQIGITNGHPLMCRVTGTGCIASALIAAFAAVDPDPVAAAATGLAVFGLAGEIAGETADAPGSFMIRLLDALYTVTPAQVREGARIEGD